jgi:hypothetical protein
MIRSILGLHRAPEVEMLEFRNRIHGQLETILPRYCEIVGATGFKIHDALQVWENVRFQAIWGGTEPFDLIVEIWWEDGSACREGTQRPEAIELVMGLQGQDPSLRLIDSNRSTLTYIQD